MKLDDIKNMPPAVKAGATLAAGGGVMAALAMMFPPSILVIIAGGVALVAALFVGYKALLKWLEKRKAAPMERAIAGNSAAAPTSINNPARRARLDDMRKSFETGVDKFKEAGKNIYSLPWYILVGEPGSGKTEAIRHCNVGFPPGLQDQLQGVGGTINMNWWFTNYAVILDTAGRLMFEEVEPGTTSEWQEFLKLLRKVRPNCPVNGLLLVIPAESLIRDTADAIERKAGKIAQQLDAIQRALGVRFPVYVVVTKCDLINGFREFFDDLTDPQVQHQMLGWSNPASLDEAFNPEQVEQHLRTVQQRLVRRRMGLLQDPIHTEDATRKRTEQVDALYAFPDSMMKIAPRLRRYLEMIFVAGEWSSKPLFLRGIYFTSSMREGSALDADLAEALGMPVESLPEGRVWERERAYFLRDLFMNKVFREKGLVTRATNTSAQMRKRRSVLYGTAAVGTIVVALFTFLGWRGLSKAVAEPGEFWAKTKEVYVGKGETNNWVSRDHPYLFPIARPQANDQAVFYYDGTAPAARKEIEAIPVSDAAHATIGDFPTELMEQARRTIGIPWVYKPVAAVTGFNVTNLAAGERAGATAALFERSVVEPLVDYARVKLASDIGEDAAGSAWSPPATAALRELIGVEAGLVSPDVRTEQTVQLAPLATYVLRQEEFEKAGASGIDFDAYKAAQADSSRQIKALQDVADWLYDPKRGGQHFPPPQMRSGDIKILGKAFDRYRKQIGNDPAEAGAYAQVKALIEALKQFEDAERALIDVHTQSDVAKAWEERYLGVREAGDKVNSLISVVENRPLKQAFNEEFGKYQKAIEGSHDALLARFVPVIALDGAPDEKLVKAHKDKMEDLQTLHDQIRRSKAELATRSTEIDRLASECAALDIRMLKITGRTDFAFRQRLEVYSTADKVRHPAGSELEVDVGALPDRLGTVERAVAEAKGKIEQLQKAGTSGNPDAKSADDLMSLGAGAATKYATDIAGGQRRVALLDKWADNLLGDGKGLEVRAAALAQAKNLRLARPLVPLTRAAAAADKRDSFNPSFDSRVASLILADCAQIDAGAKAGQMPKATADRADQVRKEAERYSEKYVQYWSRDLAADLGVVGQSWAEFSAAIKTLSSANFNTPLAETCDIVIAQMKDVPGLMRTPAGDPMEIRRLADAAKTSLQNHPGISSGRVFSQWRGLGENSADAGNLLRAAMRDLPAFEEQYIICAGRAQGQPAGNLVEGFWEDFCYAAVKSLADRAMAEGNEAFVNVKKGMKFPIVLAGGEGEISAEDVGRLKQQVEQAAVIGGKKADAAGAPRGAITCTRFSPLISQLQGAGALQAGEQDWLDRVREVVAGLPEGQALKAKVSTVGDRQLGAGEQPLSSPFLEMAIVAGAQVPPKGEFLRVMSANLGEFKYPEGGGLGFHFFKAGGAGKPDFSFQLEGSWAVIKLLNQYEAERSASDKKVWFVKLAVLFNNDKFYTWLKVEMEKELPELARWRQLKPAP